MNGRPLDSARGATVRSARTLERDVLEITAFGRPRDYGEHFMARYGPTIAARANASRTGREAEFDEALDGFCDEWNWGTDNGDRCRCSTAPACRSPPVRQ